MDLLGSWFEVYDMSHASQDSSEEDEEEEGEEEEEEDSF